ncbi:MAG: hypothetical protein QNL62_25305 [Gammaproteobacteria bacterium]|nr:hypothetical protein [Gammaproteobacteria bacterium]
MKLVWDNQQFKVTIKQVDIYITPEKLPPFPINAIVIEQDTSLILEPDDKIRDSGDDKPLWYDANTAQLSTSHQPGDVIIKPGKPIRLFAIVHDLDQTPSWQTEWIETALKHIFTIINEKRFPAIRLPVLGTQFGRIKLDEFVSILIQVLKQHHFDHPLRVWLAVKPEKCQVICDLFNKKLNFKDNKSMLD